MSVENLKIITQEYENLKGQYVLVHNESHRLIGICEDECDYYYCLYDGRRLHLTTCLTRITPLKGYILDDHYKEMLRLAQLNHYDQLKLGGNSSPNETAAFNAQHKEDLLSTWDDGTRFILGPFWDLV
jgi:hypothetical protein